VFTRSSITPPKMNRFGWNLEDSEHIPGDFGRDPRSSESWRARRNFVFFCQVSNARFYRFPVGQISWNLTITRRSVRWWILSEQNFGNFSVRGCFKKHTKVEFFFNVLRLQASSNSAMIIDRQKFITKWSLYGMSSFHFAVGITQSHSLAYTLRTRNLPKFPATPDADWRHATTLTVKVGVTWWRHHATPKER